MDNRIIEGLSIVDLIKIIEKKNKRFQAIILQSLEESFNQDLQDYLYKNKNLSEKEIENFKINNKNKYMEIRKIILDWSNDYTRSIFKTIFGTDFEGNLR